MHAIDQVGINCVKHTVTMHLGYNVAANCSLSSGTMLGSLDPSSGGCTQQHVDPPASIVPPVANCLLANKAVLHAVQTHAPTLASHPATHQMHPYGKHVVPVLLGMQLKIEPPTNI